MTQTREEESKNYHTVLMVFIVTFIYQLSQLRSQHGLSYN